MTPQEKAQELINKFKYHTRAFNETNGWVDYLHNSKQCALIAVDEILEMDLPICEEEADQFYDYWNQIKYEIEKL